MQVAADGTELNDDGKIVPAPTDTTDGALAGSWLECRTRPLAKESLRWMKRRQCPTHRIDIGLHNQDGCEYVET